MDTTNVATMDESLLNSDMMLATPGANMEEPCGSRQSVPTSRSC